MPSSFDSLPYEILSLILLEAARLNVTETATYTYGLTDAPQPLKPTKLERYVRGQKPADVLRWDLVDSIRRVNSTWHTWALDFALRELYIRRWRGSERLVRKDCHDHRTIKSTDSSFAYRWLESYRLQQVKRRPTGEAVYRSPYNALEASVALHTYCPKIAQHIQRLWFDGFLTPESNVLLFRTLDNCTALRSLTLPWTTLRFCDACAWSSLLRHKYLSTLEFTAVDLKQSQVKDDAYSIDLQALEDPSVDFSAIQRLRIFGSTNQAPINDADLGRIARSASNLKELHITGTSDITIDGVFAIANASCHSLKVLEYLPTRTTPPPKVDSHYCRALLACSNVRDIDISLPSVCPHVFDDLEVKWVGHLRVRAADICSTGDQPSCGKDEKLKALLDKARRFVVERDQNSRLNIEIEIGEYSIFLLPTAPLTKMQVTGSSNL